MSVQGTEWALNGDFSMSIPRAKIDRESAALFGMKRRISGDMPYYTDVYALEGTNERVVALFGDVRDRSRRRLGATHAGKATNILKRADNAAATGS